MKGPTRTPTSSVKNSRQHPLISEKKKIKRMISTDQGNQIVVDRGTCDESVVASDGSLDPSTTRPMISFSSIVHLRRHFKRMF